MWLYIMNRQQKIEHIPLGPHNIKGADIVIQPKMNLWQDPVKSIFLGEVARPLTYRNFDGLILLERVSDAQVITKLSVQTNYSDNVHIPGSILNLVNRKY